MSRTFLLRAITPLKGLRLTRPLLQRNFLGQEIAGKWFPYCATHRSLPVELHCFRGYCSTHPSLPLQQDTEESSSQDVGQATSSSNAGGPSKMPVSEKPSRVGVRYNCSGCGAVLQSTYPKRRGYIIQEKLNEWLELASDPSRVLTEGSAASIEAKESRAKESSDGDGSVSDNSQDESEEGEEEVSMLEGEDGEEEDYDTDTEDYFPETLDIHEEASNDVSSFICSRCFSLKNYNNALNIALESDDYLRHLSSLKKKRALILLMLDITDFPCCVFPNLKSLLSPDCSVLIVVNKIDLFPRNLKERFWSMLRTHVVTGCKASIGSRRITGVRFISVSRGIGTTELSEEIVSKWGTKGDIYLMGCTNVGKSSLFNKLLLHLCGSRPGELNVDSNLLAPKATISQWPGTTLGLLSFPLMSVGKRRRLLEQQRRKEWEIAVGIKKYDDYYEEDKDDFHASIQKYDEAYDPLEKQLLAKGNLSQVEVEGVIEELGLRKKRKVIVSAQEVPQNKYWLHDTPGAINEAQLINHLTPKELTLGLPKVPLRPRTFILRPGQCLFLGGLARLDYVQGSVSAYFTAFAWPYLHLHATKTENADILYQRHLNNPESIFEIPIATEERSAPFPPLEHQDLTISGIGWTQSAADVVLSSAGWVAVTAGGQDPLILRAHTPKGKGIYLRKPTLFGDAINQRGKREKYGNRTSFLGNMKKWKHAYDS